MLEYLRIRNLALIEDAELDFAPGMNVLTGETGQAKLYPSKPWAFCWATGWAPIWYGRERKRPRSKHSSRWTDGRWSSGAACWPKAAAAVCM